MKHLLSLITIFALTTINIFAQQTVNQEPTMADKMYEDGRIYVVVAVVATIFAVIIAYLINMDSKISKLEKQIKK
jgi:hypothetical protein